MLTIENLCITANASANDNRTFFNYLTSQYNLKLEKFNSSFEYEIKLCHFESDLKKGITTISNGFESGNNFFVLRCNANSDYMIDYLTDNDREYSIFVYENKRMLKIKKHFTQDIGEFKLFKSREIFEYDIEAISEIINNTNIHYVSRMRKIRAKNFVFDVTNGLIFASAITKCIASDQEQLQYELEYYGHFPLAHVNVTDMYIANQLESACSHLKVNADFVLTPCCETKFGAV